MTYNYRSAQLTAGNKLTAGAQDIHDHRDRLVRAQRDEQPLLSCTIDTTKPTGSSLTTTNHAGGIVGQGGDGGLNHVHVQ